MIVQILLARILSSDDFGVLAILLVVTNVADSIAQSGLGLALIQKRDSDEKAYSTALWLSLAIAVGLYAIVFAGAPLLADFYGMSNLDSYLRVLALIVLFNSANSVQRSYLQKSFDFKGLFRVSLFAVIASGIVGLAGAWLGFGVWALVAQSLSQSVFMCVAMAVVAPWKPSLHFSAREAKDLLGYGWKICITGILNVLYTGVSELVLGRACSAGDLGYYSNGRKYPQAAIGVMTNAVGNVLFPAFSSVKDDPNALQAGLRRMLSLGTFVIAPVSLLFAVVAEPVVAILLTEKWLPCVPVFQLTCVSNSLLMFQLVNLRAYMALGDSGLYARLQVIKVVGGGAVICGTAVATSSIYATAVATCLVGVASILLVDMQPAKRMHGYGRLQQLKDQAGVLALAVAASAAAVPVGFAGLSYVAELIVRVAVFAAVYLGGARLFHVGASEELLGLLVGTKGRQ